MKYVLPGEETKRLRFRLLEKGDLNTWIDFFREPGVAGFVGLGHLTSAEEKAQKWFELIENRYQKDLGGMNVLIDKESGAFIGQCGLLIQEVDGQKELEIGYSIMPKHWNKGYASEAAKKCRDLPKADFVLLTHSHYDHLDDIISHIVLLLYPLYI